MENQSAIGCYWPLLVEKRCKSRKTSENEKKYQISLLSFLGRALFISLAARVSTVLVLFLLMTGRPSPEFLVHNDSLGFLPHLITDSSSRFILEQMPVVVEQKATLKFVPQDI